MTTYDTDGRDLTWLATSFAQRIPGVRDVLVLSTDGLVLARSEGLQRETAETLAAVTSGLASLTAGAARHLHAGQVNQVIVEMDHGFLFVTAISEGSCLAVFDAVVTRLGKGVDEHGRIADASLRSTLALLGRFGRKAAFTCGPPGITERLPRSAARSPSSATRSGGTNVKPGSRSAK